MKLTKLIDLSSANSNTQMETSAVSQSLFTSPPSRPLHPSGTAQIIAYELDDRARRKNNIIVYNYTDAVDHQTDKESFSALCKGIFYTHVKVLKMIRLGKKGTSKQRPALIGLENEELKNYILSHSYLLCCKNQYKNVFISPDRTRFEREKN